jgi:PEP-CTERM motif
MRLVLAILAASLLVSVPPAEADTIRDYDFRGFSKPLDVRIGISHDDLGDSRSRPALTVYTSRRHDHWDMPIFDKSDRHHKGFPWLRPERKDVPMARVPEPATLLLVSVGIIGMIAAYRLLPVQTAGRL